MTSKVAAWISRGIIVLAVALMAVTFLLSARIPSSPIHAPVVIGNLPIPTTCEGTPTDAVARDTQEAWCQVRDKIAKGTLSPLTALTLGNLIAALMALLWIVTGNVIVSRQPRNLAGWLFAVIGLAWVTEAFGVAATSWGIFTAHNLPAPGLFAILADVPLSFALLLPLLFLLYPDGRAPARWRWLTWVFAGAIAALIFGYTLAPGPLNNLVDTGILYANPIGVAAFGAVYGPLAAVGSVVMLGACLATVLAIRSRYRRATGETRQQMRWLVAVAGLAGILIVLGILVTIGGTTLGLSQNAPVFVWVLIALASVIAIGVPAAYLVAIFRYRLWDLDVVIRKAVVVALVGLGLTVLAILVPVGVVALVGVGGTIQPVSIVVGLLLGLLFWPVRRWARKVADRVVYGSRATPYEVLTDFGQRVSETYSADDVLPRMAQVLGEATGASTARVWVLVGGALGVGATWPPGAADVPPVPVIGDHAEIGADAWEVRHQGDLLGALSVEMPANDPLDPARAQLGSDLAAQAGLVLRNVGLIEELRASRRRIVTAQDERAKKLERNIHDGAQQQLVALSVKLRLAETLAERDPDRAKALLAELQGDVASALEDLRDLARGIYPPLLADQGLVAALEAQARKASAPTTVHANGVRRYAPDVEAAVYFCSLEALQNVAKYAKATSVRIDLAHSDGQLDFAVVDDGAGFDPSAAHGSGLQGMHDRLEALGGTVRIESRPGAGTQVRGSVPVAAVETTTD